MSEDIPLTALCAICHIGDQKYTCPRCGIHTCSLPCVKLHKKRASCSGVRDPTQYRKRADLATASSIDSDFNFITSLERSLSKADETKDAIRISRAAHDSVRLEALVKERNITWRRAPKGMKRRQENDTRIEHGHVTWTMEFLLADGARQLSAVPETQTMSEAWNAVVFPSKAVKKRRRGYDDDGKPVKKQMIAENVAATAPAYTGEERFYLLRPNTSSKLKVLRPIDKSEVMSDVLRDRTVLECPTIYVKHEPPEQLSPPFMLEDKYLSEHGEDVTIPISTEVEEGEIEEDASSVLKALEDPSKVFSVLQADLST